MTTEADIEGLAMALMAENVGREDLQLHPLEWHWRERFRHQDRREYRSVARSVLTSDWLDTYVAARVAEAYEAGWRDACDDWLEQMRNPAHPIGTRKRRYDEVATP